MNNKPTAKNLISTLSLSQGHAYDILRGSRPPSRALAIAIYRAFGWKHETISDLSSTQIAMLEELEPWKPSLK